MKRVRRHELRAAAERYLDAASDQARSSPLTAPLAELVTTVDQAVNPIHLLVAQLGEDQTGGLAAARGADLALMVLEVTGGSPQRSLREGIHDLASAMGLPVPAVALGEDYGNPWDLLRKMRVHVTSVEHLTECAGRLERFRRSRARVRKVIAKLKKTRAKVGA